MEEENKTQEQPNNPLHGVKLATILDTLVDHYGWEALGDRIKINCFQNNPTKKSSLNFLRKTPWARDKVEQLYLKNLKRFNGGEGMVRGENVKAVKKKISKPKTNPKPKESAPAQNNTKYVYKK
ncbi:hypothetical protein DIT68_09040 [Brumimicrobium oceani]|uniref:Transporter n=1 Tax=Brumimicrobium oceani TaxID=2100725 RepID=A0A2U2XC68_9FLAO|nr:hypothetical protein DIT68_09040 [Brumimicrobium oceani]